MTRVSGNHVLKSVPNKGTSAMALPIFWANTSFCTAAAAVRALSRLSSWKSCVCAVRIMLTQLP